MSSRYTCSRCPRTFSDNSHLRRHEVAHSGVRPFRCPVCDRSFARTDVAHRHVKKCGLRSGHPVLVETKLGRRRKACDNCARRKKACDQKKPCMACQVDGLSCTLDRLCDNAAPRSTVQTEASSSPSKRSRPERIPITFLLNYTNPSNETRPDLHRAFDVVVPTSEDEILGSSEPCLSEPLPERWSELEAWLPVDRLVSQSYPFMDYWFDANGYDESSGYDINTPTAATTSVERLEDRANEMQTQLLDFSARTKSFRPKKDTDTAGLLRNLFTATNIHDFTQAYFDRFHIHIPIIHRPTFDAESVSLQLLLAVFLIGSIQSAPKDQYFLAEECIDLAEEYIFEAEGLKRLFDGDLSRAEVDTTYVLELLQAAALMVGLQAIANSKRFRQTRIRRFPLVVSAIRTLALTSTTNQYRSFSETPTADVWHSFAIREAQVRLGSFAYMLDSHCTIFCHSPPLFTITEMRGSFPCCDLLFDAENEVEFGQAARGKSAIHPASLHTCMTLLLSDVSVEIDDPRLSYLSIFDMFLIISALHSLIFTAQTNLTITDSLVRFERALSQWKRIWNRQSKQASLGQPMGKGFMTCAVELWWLAHVYLRRQDDRNIDLASREDLYKLLTTIDGYYS